MTEAVICNVIYLWGVLKLAHTQSSDEEKTHIRKQRCAILWVTILNVGITAAVIMVENTHHTLVLDSNRYHMVLFLLLAFFFGIVGRLYVKFLSNSSEGGPFRKKVIAITVIGGLCLSSRGLYNLLFMF